MIAHADCKISAEVPLDYFEDEKRIEGLNIEVFNQIFFLCYGDDRFVFELGRESLDDVFKLLEGMSIH